MTDKQQLIKRINHSIRCCNSLKRYFIYDNKFKELKNDLLYIKRELKID